MEIKADFINIRTAWSFLKNQDFLLSLYRICFGLILFFRIFNIYSAKDYYDVNIDFYFGFHFFLIISVLFGFFPRLIFLMLFFLSKKFDIVYQTSTLGTDLVMILSLFFFTTDVGFKFFSIEGKWELEARLFSKFRYITFDKQKSGEWALVFYGLLSLFAVIYHLDDPLWRNGDNARIMLVNSYLSKYYLFFRGIEQTIPGIFVLFSKASIFGQTLFQLCFLPFLFFYWGRVFIFLWGICFFIVSKFFLQLSYLPDLEFILWFVVFSTIRFGEIKLIYFEKKDLFFVFFLILNVFFYFSPNSWLMKKIPRHAFLTAPNVFNSQDLKMGDIYPVFYCEENKKSIMPLTDHDGSRLELHKHDQLYFGNSLRWRRFALKFGLGDLNNPKNPLNDLLVKIVQFENKRSGCRNMSVDILSCKQSDVSMEKNKYETKTLSTLYFKNQ
jgi:hypothetical protein